MHGQGLWNFRYHLDDEGRILTVGKVDLWDQPFNEIQFREIFFTVLVTTDRLYPCLEAIRDGAAGSEEAFEKFFLTKEADDKERQLDS